MIDQLPNVPHKIEVKQSIPNPRANLLDDIRKAGNLNRLKAVQSNESKEDRMKTNTKPLSIADEMRQKLFRRQAIISGKQDKLEQKKEKESSKLKNIITANSVDLPQPSTENSHLPVVNISDDEDDGAGVSNTSPGLGREGDMLSQLRSIQQKHLKPPPSTPPSIDPHNKDDVSHLFLLSEVHLILSNFVAMFF